VTFTFDLGGHGACRWYGSSCPVCVPSLNFVGLPIRKILGIYCASINPPSYLDLWPLNPKTVSLLVYPKVIPYTKFEHFRIIRFRVMLRTNRPTDKQTDSKILPTPTDSEPNRLQLYVKVNVKVCGTIKVPCIRSLQQSPNISYSVLVLLSHRSHAKAAESRIHVERYIFCRRLVIYATVGDRSSQVREICLTFFSQLCSRWSRTCER